MQVYKCDRCGSVYHQNTEKWRDPLIYRITWNYQPRDLCDNCLKELLSWVLMQTKEVD